VDEVRNVIWRIEMPEHIVNALLVVRRVTTQNNMIVTLSDFWLISDPE